MSGFSSKSVFSTCSSSSSTSTSSTSSFASSKITWLSCIEVEAAMEREKRLIAGGDEEEVSRLTSRDREAAQIGKKDWKRSVGPNTGRKLGKILSKSSSIRSLVISAPIQLKPLDDPSTAFNRTPPVSASTGVVSRSSPSSKWHS